MLSSTPTAVPLPPPPTCCMVPPPPPSRSFSSASKGCAVNRRPAWIPSAERAFGSPPLVPSSSPSSSSSSLSSLSESALGGGGNTARQMSSLCEEEISSSRGRRAVSLLPVYLTDARSVTQYHPTEAPDGPLQLSVAENQMLEDLLLPALHRFASQPNDKDDGDDGDGSNDALSALFRSDQIYYQPTHGRPGLRNAVAGYLQKLLRIPAEARLDTEGLVCGAGCNAVLENLCFTLTEPGDAVLLPTPYYAAFEFDLVARAGLNIVPVNTMAHNQIHTQNTDTTSSIPKSAYYPNTASLDEAYQTAKANGTTPKILLLSHPNNPLGISYPPQVVQECIQWARQKKVHLVSDEIYAGSIHATDKHLFHSALKLAASTTPTTTTTTTTTDATNAAAEPGLGLGPYVHFVYALSKDFALSGLRVGVSYSENKAIRTPLQKLNDLCQISSQTQLMVENMLSAPTSTDPSSDHHDHHHGEPHQQQLWSTDTFLPLNQDRIRQRCDRLHHCLDESGIPYLNADSGMFVWMDLTQFLPPSTTTTTTITTTEGQPQQQHYAMDESEESKDERERALYLDLLHEFGLLFTPGRSMRNELPGFFRCVFTAASDDEFELGLERIKLFVDAKRK